MVPVPNLDCVALVILVSNIVLVVARLVTNAFGSRGVEYFLTESELSPSQ
jgi:hypothetical protein